MITGDAHETQPFVPTTQSTFLAHAGVEPAVYGFGLITHTQLPGVLVSLVIVVFAIGNAVLGTFLMWRLVNS